MKKILIVGSSGLMGSTFMDMVPSSIGVDEKILNITQEKSVEDFFEKREGEFEVVINFAAYTNVDGAEKEKGDKGGLVWKLNVEGVANLAKACKKYGKFLIHISTDFIFPGTKENPGPYKEDVKLPDSPSNMGWYGWTKLEGEKVLGKTNKNAAVVRTAYPFRKKPFAGKKDYAHGTLSLFDEGKLYPLFSDQKLTPVLIEDLVEILQKVAKLKKPGVYHVVTVDATTPFEFGSYLIEKARGEKNAVKKGSMEEFLKAPGRTPRPRFGGFDTKETQEKLGMKFKTWKEAVDEFVKQSD